MSQIKVVKNWAVDVKDLFGEEGRSLCCQWGDRSDAVRWLEDHESEFTDPILVECADILVDEDYQTTIVGSPILTDRQINRFLTANYGVALKECVVERMKGGWH